MIIKCPHCDGKMRVDESRLPSGERAKVRCPHCKKISSVGDLTNEPGRSGTPGLAAGAAGGRENVTRGKAMDHEPTFPKDAFQNFQGSTRSVLRAVIWIVVSLAVVGFFALLVNIVLPGPYGESFIGGRGKTQQALPKMPSADEGPNPNSAQPGRGR